jgi:hypothetical protein
MVGDRSKSIRSGGFGKRKSWTATTSMMGVRLASVSACAWLSANEPID